MSTINAISKSDAWSRFGAGAVLDTPVTLTNYVEEHCDLKLMWDENRRTIHLARYIVSMFGNCRAYLLFDEIGIWPSHENRNLMEYLSAAYTMAADSIYRDCIVFDDGEDVLRLSFVQLGMDYGWGGLYFIDNRRWFRFNHDSHGFVRCGQDLRAELAKLPVITKLSSYYGDASAVTK